jgi:hypothetical protein
MFDGLQRALALKAARWAGTLAGGAIFGFLLSHTQIMAWVTQACSSLSSKDTLEDFAGGVAVALLPLVYSILDAKNVDAKVKAAAITGEASAANDKAVISQVKAAGTPDALAALQAKLQQGKV